MQRNNVIAFLEPDFRRNVAEKIVNELKIDDIVELSELTDEEINSLTDVKPLLRRCLLEKRDDALIEMNQKYWNIVKQDFSSLESLESLESLSLENLEKHFTKPILQMVKKYTKIDCNYTEQYFFTLLFMYMYNWFDTNTTQLLAKKPKHRLVREFYNKHVTDNVIERLEMQIWRFQAYVNCRTWTRSKAYNPQYLQKNMIEILLEYWRLIREGREYEKQLQHQDSGVWNPSAGDDGEPDWDFHASATYRNESKPIDFNKQFRSRFT